MNAYLSRLIAIILLCFISLMNKSEVKCCKDYSCIESKSIKENLIDLNEYDTGMLQYEGFFIKI